jgi:hypothetical protein
LALVVYRPSPHQQQRDAQDCSQGAKRVALNTIHLTSARVGSRELILQEIEFVQDSREVRLR